MKIEKAILDNAIGLVGSIPDRKALESSRFVMLRPSKSKTGFTAQLRAEAACQVQVAGKEGQWPFDQPIFIDRRFMLSWLKSRTGKVVDITAGKNTIVLKCGSAKAELPIAEAVTGYYEFSAAQGKAIKLSEDDIKTIQASLVCAATDEAEPQIMCVYLDGKGFVYSTNHLAAFFAKVAYKGDVVPLPLPIVPLLSSAEKVGIGKEVRLKFASGLTVQALPMDAKREFPVSMIRNGITALKNMPTFFEATASALGKALASLDSATNKSENTVYVEITAGTQKGKPMLKMTAKIAEGASFHQLVGATQATPVEGGAMLALAHMRQAVKTLASLHTGEGPATIKVHMGEQPFIILRCANAGYMIARPID